jgi:hypothetical protein
MLQEEINCETTISVREAVSNQSLSGGQGTVPTVWYFSICFCNCSDSVVFFYLFLELFRQCGIFLFVFVAVPTVWYFSICFCNCSDSVVFFYLFPTVGTGTKKIEKYHTVGTVTKTIRKIPHCRNSYKNK